LIKEKVLNWAQQFNTFCFLDNHQYHIKPNTQECLLATGIKGKLFTGPGISQLQEYLEEKKNRWLFGHLNYDLKNGLEALSSQHHDHIEFPEIFFFEPSVLISINENSITIQSEDPPKIFNDINAIILHDTSKGPATDILIKNRIQKEEYLSIIEKLRHHILRGDCYEINFCQEFFSEAVDIDPSTVYKKLTHISPNPFSAMYRLQDKWLMCASPERFLKKEGTNILSQPIKGTAKRIPGNTTSDKKSKEALLHSSKDRSENVMVVDLVRNDLSKVCEEGTVKVDELFGIYSFPQVHQMISTISGELKRNSSFSDIIRATFPMGSMTGAPKKRVMELIEQYEKSKRGIFSGAVGYISPDGDFDFNVVIRSLMYNSTSRYLSFQTGSAITFYSDPEKEWEECLLKAEAMKAVFRL
jgi:para-aminobenzoate synthetase component I